MNNNSYGALELFYPYRDFRDAARAILELLHQRYGFGLWMVTKTDDEDWTVLVADDHHYNIKAGAVFRWSDSFCYRMTRGLGPNIAPHSKDIPVYAEAPIGQLLPIAAYIGLPLTNADGSLYGTLCAIDPEPQPDAINTLKERDFLFLQARLLSTMINMEHLEKSIFVELRREQRKSQIDELTGIYNRRGWENHLSIEEERCQRYNSPASIVIIDLDDLKDINDSKGHAEGDVLIQHTAECLRTVVRPFDIVARLGGDEFALLIVEARDDLTQELVNRVRTHLRNECISASIGWAVRSTGQVNTDVAQLKAGAYIKNTLNDVMQRADENMYEDKSSHKRKRKKRRKSA